MKEHETSTTAGGWVDPDDAPDWTPEMFDLAEVRHGDQVLKPATGVLKRGRPKLESPKVRVTLRLDADVLSKLKERGPGWQTTANALLRKATGV